jgi:hypothetical protein
MPALPGPPPRRNASPEELARFEDGALQLASIAALAGVPQVNLAALSHLECLVTPMHVWRQVRIK